ncbi:hypothetical protein [Streptomyces tateyamensis]|nr:hypothetical protein [Streptomyces tateyamensis]
MRRSQAEREDEAVWITAIVVAVLLIGTLGALAGAFAGQLMR